MIEKRSKYSDNFTMDEFNEFSHQRDSIDRFEDVMIEEEVSEDEETIVNPQDSNSGYRNLLSFNLCSSFGNVAWCQ